MKESRTLLTDKWVEEHLGDLMVLAMHLVPENEDGTKTWHTNIIDELVRDMLNDILEAWEDVHKHDPCIECHRQNEIRNLLSEAPDPVSSDLVEQIWRKWTSTVPNKLSYSVVGILLDNPKLSEDEAEELYRRLCRL